MIGRVSSPTLDWSPLSLHTYSQKSGLAQTPWRHGYMNNGIQHNDIQYNDTYQKWIICDIQLNETQHKDTQHNKTLPLC
jgi:hypothetical protein